MTRKTGYKKYMKKEAQKRSNLLKIFILSFFGMLMVFTFIFKSFLPSVDTSIGEYAEEIEIEQPEPQNKVDVDDRLALIQKEDQGNASDFELKKEEQPISRESSLDVVELNTENKYLVSTQKEPVYKVFVGAYTTAEQAKVAKEIIEESGNGLNPIVKCLGSNNYSLQVGIFRNKQGADILLEKVQQNRLPGRIIEDY